MPLPGVEWDEKHQDVVCDQIDRSLEYSRPIVFVYVTYCFCMCDFFMLDLCWGKETFHILVGFHSHCWFSFSRFLEPLLQTQLLERSRQGGKHF